MVHGSLGDALPTWYPRVEELRRYLEAGSSGKQALYQCFFWKQKCDILEKSTGYRLFESFVDHMPSSVPALYFKGLQKSDTVKAVSGANMFRFPLNGFHLEKSLQIHDARHF